MPAGCYMNGLMTAKRMEPATATTDSTNAHVSAETRGAREAPMPRRRDAREVTYQLMVALKAAAISPTRHLVSAIRYQSRGVRDAATKSSRNHVVYSHTYKAPKASTTASAVNTARKLAKRQCMQC